MQTINERVWGVLVAACGSYDRALSLWASIPSPGEKHATAREIAVRAGLGRHTTLRGLSWLTARRCTEHGSLGWRKSTNLPAPVRGEAPAEEVMPEPGLDEQALDDTPPETVDRKAWDSMSEVAGGPDEMIRIWEALVLQKGRPARLATLVATSALPRDAVRSVITKLIVAGVVSESGSGWTVTGRWIPPKEAE